MSRRVRIVALAVLVLVLTAAVALVVTGRSALDDELDVVDDRWEPLRTPLTERYDALGAVLEQLRVAGAQDRDVTRDLDDELQRWADVRDSDEAGAQAETANALEGLAARVRKTVDASGRLRGAQPLVDALSQFSATAPPGDVVQRYNSAARDYQETRESLLRKPVARLLGYDARPALALSV